MVVATTLLLLVLVHMHLVKNRSMADLANKTPNQYEEGGMAGRRKRSNPATNIANMPRL